MGRKKTETAARSRAHDETIGVGSKRGLEHLGVSRETANLLTVGGTCVVIVSSGAWLVSHLLTDTRASLVSVQRELFSQSEHMRSFISGSHYPKQSPEKTPSEQTASSKKMLCV